MTMDYSTSSYAPYIAAAVADGWKAKSHARGDVSRDRSVELVRELPELSGHLLVWLIDRDYSRPTSKIVDGQWEKEDHWFTEEPHVIAWFVQTYENSNMTREQGLSVGKSDLTEYDLDFWLKKANWCAHCKQVVPANQLNRVGFAGHACNNCLEAQRKIVEKPGWCD